MTQQDAMRVGLFLWKRIPDKIVEARGGKAGLKKWIDAGARTLGDEDGDDDATFILFDGDEQLGGYDGDTTDGFLLFDNPDGSLGLLMWCFISNEDPDDISPEISVSEEGGWDMPDESFTLRCYEHKTNIQIRGDEHLFTKPEKQETALKALKKYIAAKHYPFYIYSGPVLVSYLGWDEKRIGKKKLDDIVLDYPVKILLPDFEPVVKFMRKKKLGIEEFLASLETSGPMGFALQFPDELCKAGFRKKILNFGSKEVTLDEP